MHGLLLGRKLHGHRCERRRRDLSGEKFAEGGSCPPAFNREQVTVPVLLAAVTP